jgi:exoribonuclease R
MKKEVIIWKFQSKAEHFGFVIPEERAYWGGDFFVNKDNFNGAKDGDKVEARELLNSKWKKPEAKILSVIGWKKKVEKKPVLKVVEWIYSWWDGNFWFVDVEWQEQGYFVYGKKKNGAEDGDRVKAEVVDFKWKEEAIVIEVLGQETETLEWVFKDNDRFGFVIPDDKSWDIFIAGSRKWEAQDRDRVEVKIIKRWGKNPEWLITKVL